MPRIYADFIDCDTQGRIRLDIPGSLRDLEAQADNVVPGLRVVLCMTDEFEVEGGLIRKQMLRIYADFNNSDEQGRVRLNTMGSLKDLDSQKDSITDGLRVILYVTDELEVEGTLIFEEIWLGIPDWNTIKYMDEAKTPT